MLYNQISLSLYQEIAPLCPKGHVVLVKNIQNNQLYVKKTIYNCSADVFCLLQSKKIDNTPQIYGIYPNNDNLVIIEEYISGITLAEKISQEGLLSEKEIINISLQLCKILDALHNLSPAVIHRDIKPSNIMISTDGNVNLLDFNAAKLHNDTGTRDTVLLGTEGYAAPEQYGFSSSSVQTDIYAVGVLINVCLTGKLPAQKLYPCNLNKVICRCTALDPKDRYGSAKELSHALKRADKVKVNWFPPGFRTFQPFKMVAASFFYILFFSYTCNMSMPQSSELNIYIFRSIFILAGLSNLFFFTNYLDIRKYYPFLKSRFLFLRILGYILAPVLNCFISIVIPSLIEAILL